MRREPRVELRPTIQHDIEIFFDHQRDAASVRMAAFTSDDPNDRQAHDAHWRRLLDSDSIIVRTILVDDEVAGHIAGFERDGAPEITYWIDRRLWGRGVATAATALFLEKDTRRPLYARAAADNIGSRRVLERCGFVEHERTRGFASARGEEIEEVVMVLGPTLPLPQGD